MATRRRSPRASASELLELPIAGPMAAYDELLAAVFAGREPRHHRGEPAGADPRQLLMALSNKFGWLVLTTGNKSEMSVGYSTLYGDSAGGFAVIKDVPKTLVFRLARLRNERAGRADPRERASRGRRRPSCGPTRQDADSLPPYEVLDPILEGYVEHDLGAEQLVARGFDAATVERIIRLVDLAEYKRRQQPPGIKITSEGVRPRPADADHEPLPRLACRAQALRSLLAGLAVGQRAHGDRHPHERAEAVLRRR